MSSHSGTHCVPLREFLSLSASQLSHLHHEALEYMRSRYPLSSDTLWFSLRTCLSSCESAQNRGGSGVFCVCEDPGPQVPVRLPDAAAAATENLFLGICESQVLPPLKGSLEL